MMKTKHLPSGPIALHDEIHRLQTINAELLEALVRCVELLDDYQSVQRYRIGDFDLSIAHIERVKDVSKTAIAKAKGESQ